MLKSQNHSYDNEAAALLKEGYSDVLAFVTSSEPWSAAAFASVDIAAMFNAHVTMCHIDSSHRSLRGFDGEPAVVAPPLNSLRTWCGDSDAFSAFARERGVRRVLWMLTRVTPAKTLRSLGAWHDLIVLERDLALPAEIADVLGEVLLTCRAPCLLLPPRWDKPLRIDHIAIAWNGSIESARATHASLPLARIAQHVTVLRDAALAMESEEPQSPPFDPVLYLRGHGVKVSEIPLYANSLVVGQAILDEARRLAADCLVMGAYGHTRVREQFLGGATLHTLQHADIPVLMQH